MNQPLEEIQPTFQKWMDKVDSCSRGKAFRTLEYIFKNEEVAYVVATEAIEND